MSYCRWSSPVPELTPDVDVSFEKEIELCKEFGYDGWKKFVKENNVQMSEAYVYETDFGFICHWTCDESFITETAREMAEHLLDAIENGKKVPMYAVETLLKEEEDNDLQPMG